jgi:hypothetical protein
MARLRIMLACFIIPAILTDAFVDHRLLGYISAIVLNVCSNSSGASASTFQSVEFISHYTLAQVVILLHTCLVRCLSSDLRM